MSQEKHGDGLGRDAGLDVEALLRALKIKRPAGCALRGPALLAAARRDLMQKLAHMNHAVHAVVGEYPGLEGLMMRARKEMVNHEVNCAVAVGTPLEARETFVVVVGRGEKVVEDLLGYFRGKYQVVSDMAPPAPYRCTECRDDCDEQEHLCYSCREKHESGES